MTEIGLKSTLSPHVLSDFVVGIRATEWINSDPDYIKKFKMDRQRSKRSSKRAQKELKKAQKRSKKIKEFDIYLLFD